MVGTRIRKPRAGRVTRWVDRSRETPRHVRGIDSPLLPSPPFRDHLGGTLPATVEHPTTYLHSSNSAQPCPWQSDDGNPICNPAIQVSMDQVENRGSRALAVTAIPARRTGSSPIHWRLLEASIRASAEERSTLNKRSSHSPELGLESTNDHGVVFPGIGRTSKLTCPKRFLRAPGPHCKHFRVLV